MIGFQKVWINESTPAHVCVNVRHKFLTQPWPKETMQKEVMRSIVCTHILCAKKPLGEILINL